MTSKNNDEPKNQYSLHLEQVQLHKETNQLLKELISILDGFTNSGASLQTVIPDQAFLAYLSVVGPAIARHLDDKVGAEEIKKGGVHLGKSLIDEFSAFSSCQTPEDQIYKSLEFLNNKGKEDPAR
tara:strand:- start:1371 stop:1748 length:378 start_codon:yes stop_codon:yes gene_type:complete